MIFYIRGMIKPGISKNTNLLFESIIYFQVLLRKAIANLYMGFIKDKLIHIGNYVYVVRIYSIGRFTIHVHNIT